MCTTNDAFFIGVSEPPRFATWLLRRVLYKYVPRDLIERPKKGFCVPVAAWLRDESVPQPARTARGPSPATCGTVQLTCN